MIESALKGETPRESDWGCQLIPWPLYTTILYVHVGIKSTNTVYGRQNGDYRHDATAWQWQNGREAQNMCDAHVCGSIAMHSMEMNCQE